jgi:antitoxin (DNA-binding transcriptional repressor) of toxin-antitoxin stability system
MEPIDILDAAKRVDELLAIAERGEDVIVTCNGLRE